MGKLCKNTYLDLLPGFRVWGSKYQQSPDPFEGKTLAKFLLGHATTAADRVLVFGPAAVPLGNILDLI